MRPVCHKQFCVGFILSILHVSQPLFDNCFQLRVIVELVWPLVLFLILMWVKMDNKDLQEHVHECWFCHFAFVFTHHVVMQNGISSFG